jgi:hypothetical protein
LRREGSGAFFEKKTTKKTFGSSGALPAEPPKPGVNKSFLLLFFKKAALARL